jgi:hypothetical protein
MPVRPPQRSSTRHKTAGVLAVLLALASGWYVTALGWSVLFLLGDGWLMAIYSVVLLISPALFTIIAILAFRGRARVAAGFLIPFAVKWVAVFVYSFVQGGWELLVANLPVVNGIGTLSDEFMMQYRLWEVVMLLIQFDLEPLLLVVMAVLLLRGRRRRY